MPALAKSGFIVKQAVGNLCKAVTEHRWKDALILLPTVVALSKHRISPYFLWRALHIVMLNCGVPQAIQFNILLIFFKSSVKKQDIAIDWLSHAFVYIDEENLEQVNQIITKSLKINSAMHPLGILFQGYYALFFYLKWKRLLLFAKDNDHSGEQKQLSGTLREKIKYKHQLGLKVHRLLSKAFSLLQYSEKLDMSQNEAKHFEMPCDWILGPLLELEHYVTLHEQKSEKDQSNLIDKKGLAMFQDYVAKHWTHLPALTTYYHYVITYHPEDTTLIADILKKICSLSPENCLVLNYINFLLINCNHPSVGHARPRNDDSNDDDVCLLLGKDVNTLLTCVKHLCNFLEYEMWWKHVEAWTTLTSILRLFHRGWVECWTCLECESSRSGLKKVMKTLFLWPNLFWSSSALSRLISHPKVVVHAAFTSFLFAYNKETTEESLKILDERGCQSEKDLLLSLVGLRGSYSKDFHLYLSQRRACFAAEPLSPPSPPEKSEQQKANFTVLPEITLEMSSNGCIKFQDTKDTFELPYFGKLPGSHTNNKNGNDNESCFRGVKRERSPNVSIVTKRAKLNRMEMTSKLC